MRLKGALWKEVVRRLDAVARPNTPASFRTGTQSSLAALLRQGEAPNLPRWSAAMTRSLLSKRPGGAGLCPVHGRSSAEDERDVLLGVSLIRMAHAVATDDPEAVRPVDRKWLVDALDEAGLPSLGSFPRSFAARLSALHRAASSAQARDVPVPERFAFAFPYLERRGRATVVVRGEGVGFLRKVDPVDAVTVARLPRPDGGDLELVRVGEDLYRPVLAPGRWVPVTSGAFLDAVASGEAWADNPLLPRRGRATGLLDVDDTLTTEGLGWDAKAGEEAAASCLARAGDLIVVDGVVMRNTGDPRLHLAATGTRQRIVHSQGGVHGQVSFGVAVSWSLACGLGHDEPQGPVWANARPYLRAVQNDVVRGPVTFGLGDASVLEEVAVALRGTTFASEVVTLEVTRATSHDGLWADPALFPADPSCLATAVVTFSELPLREGPGGGVAPAVVQVREAIAGRGDVRASLEAVSEASSNGTATPRDMDARMTNLLLHVCARAAIAALDRSADSEAEPDLDPGMRWW